jgi:hypothetical protein
MIHIIKQGGDEIAYVKDFVADTTADIASLPTNCAPGSSCFVIENSSVWMLNGNNVWQEI